MTIRIQIRIDQVDPQSVSYFLTNISMRTITEIDEADSRKSRQLIEKIELLPKIQDAP